MNNLPPFRLAVVSGAIPQGLYELRHDIYHLEKGFLKKDSLICEEDHIGQHICVYHGDILVASMFGIDAAQSPFPLLTGVPAASLQGCYYSTRGMIHHDYRSRNYLWPLITWLTFFTGIKLGFTNNVSLFENKAFVELIMDVEWMENIPRVMVEGVDKQYEVMPAMVGLQYGCDAIQEFFSPETKELLISQGFPCAEPFQTQMPG